MILKKLDNISLCNLLSGASIIHNGVNGPKVVKLDNGQLLKFFRLKSLFSSALFNHYADRFIANSLQLNQRGIVTVKVSDFYSIPKGYIKNSYCTKAVQYDFLPGTTVRELIKANQADDNLLINLAKFMAELHGRGIYFKAAHMANIVYNPNFAHNFGLIDIDNIKFFKKPLSTLYCERNFGHMLRYQEDKNWLESRYSLFKEHYNHYYQLY